MREKLIDMKDQNFIGTPLFLDLLNFKNQQNKCSKKSFWFYELSACAVSKDWTLPKVHENPHMTYNMT